jgi:hypothetical protein
MRAPHRLVLLWLLLLAGTLPAQRALEPAQQVANGVLLYRINDPELLSPAGPVSVQALRLDPRRVTLEITRAAGEPSRETVGAIASRRAGAVAAINAGFFSLETGKPTGLFKVGGEVVSGTSRPRGAVAILERGGRTTLLFDRVSVVTRSGKAVYSPRLGTAADAWARAPHAISGAGLLMRDGRELAD